MLKCTRQMKNFACWLEKKNLVMDGMSVFTTTPPKEVPELISLWILEAYVNSIVFYSGWVLILLQSCDDLNVDGSMKPHDAPRGSFSYAQKMRASMTYGFGRIGTCGNTPWHQSDQGEWRGNPSISNQLSRYMVSLRKRKVDTVTTYITAQLHLSYDSRCTTASLPWVRGRSIQPFWRLSTILITDRRTGPFIHTSQILGISLLRTGVVLRHDEQHKQHICSPSGAYSVWMKCWTSSFIIYSLYARTAYHSFSLDEKLPNSVVHLCINLTKFIADILVFHRCQAILFMDEARVRSSPLSGPGFLRMDRGIWDYERLYIPTDGCHRSHFGQRSADGKFDASDMLRVTHILY